jgi:3-keto-disaccharide hydrolase
MANLGYDDTPIIPGSSWHVHDGDRPQPRIVTPAPVDAPTAPPSDAQVLFDGADLSQWESVEGGEAKWKVENGYMEVVPTTRNIRTKANLGDGQYHVEWAAPEVVKGDGQGRGNSGVFLLGLYEIQVLDNYDNPTYPDGLTGGIYGQFPPLVNASRKPGEWHTYDIIWEGPKFDGDSLVTPARVTVFFNGVLLHHAKELQGPTQHKELAHYEPHATALPLMLQDHGDLVRFRNIWFRKLTEYDQA